MIESVRVDFTFTQSSKRIVLPLSQEVLGGEKVVEF